MTNLRLLTAIFPTRKPRNPVRVHCSESDCAICRYPGVIPRPRPLGRGWQRPALGWNRQLPPSPYTPAADTFASSRQQLTGLFEPSRLDATEPAPWFRLVGIVSNGDGAERGHDGNREHTAPARSAFDRPTNGFRRRGEMGSARIRTLYTTLCPR